MGLLIGLLSGLAGGITGAGGGIVAIPLMVAFLRFDQHTAHGISLVALVFTGLVGAVTHAVNGSMDPSAAVLIAASAVVTARTGARFADSLAEWKLKRAFGGCGDSACEAALALADAGAKVMISYRGKGFNRAAPKNKQSIERYAAEGRIKAKLQSQILAFDHESVTMALGDGTQKRYPNDAAFVLIGADPPVAWLEKVGIRFVERPHQFQFGKSDDIVRRFVARAVDCPEDAARAAAQVLGGSTGIEPSRAAPAVSLPMPMGDQKVCGPIGKM